MDERNPAPSDEELKQLTGKRAAWEQPVITELPKLTELTLLTGSGIPGSGNTGGGTVF